MQALRVRELYCPSHFGNVYEVAGRQEMRAILSEARSWGFNRYSDWFDTIDLLNPYGRHDEHFNLPQAVWAQKLSHYATAASLGFDLGLVITPNHVFLDQVTAQNAAEHVPGRIFGQLVCPSRPGVTGMILENYRRLFQDFVDREIRLTALSFGAYDYGGCNCASCRPWIVTFGKLARQIFEVGRGFFPNAQAELWGWWWTDEDHRAFTEWANREAPGLFSAMAHHIPYGETAYKKRPVPEGCRERAFVHIGYGDTRGIDVYGHYGPAIAPDRLAKTVAWLAQEGADGFLAYSEDVCDDVNKALVAGLSSGKYETSEAVLQAYAARYLGGEPAAWSAWLGQMGSVGAVDPARARRQFDRLAAAARPSWRLDALACKLAMREADAAVRAETAWNEARLAAAGAFWAAKERLWRQVWGRGLGRAIFKFDWLVPDWHAEYAQEIGAVPGTSHGAAADEA